jgi:hypothetical protein
LKSTYSIGALCLSLLVASGVGAVTTAARAEAPDAAAPAQTQLGGARAETAGNVAELKFREFYKLPIGPKGLEPTQKLLDLNGKAVRIRGYMAQQEVPTPGFFILSPLPVQMGDEDEKLVDDLPPAVVFVHLAGQPERSLPAVPGIVQATGVLSLGAQDEPDGHVSHVRLTVDATRPDTLLVFPPPGK